jgi:NhaP-type Na+/H+ or K+/H+ antiporter
MHDYPVVLFLAVLTFGYGLFSRLSERVPFTAPMVFVLVGVVCSPLGLGWLTVTPDDSVIRLVAEITLVSILFVEASTIDLRRMIRERAIAMRLLLVGLPLTMLLGTLVAAPLFPEMDWWLLALLAFILSPTDAALGQVVVTSERVPAPVRRAIAVESGINDGLVLPPILVCVAALGVVASEQAGGGYWLEFTFAQLVFGPLMGGAVGWLGGWAVDVCAQRKLMNDTFQRLSAICLAVIAWAVAEAFDGNGYIAAFAGGLLLGVKTSSVRERVQEYAEAEGQQLILFVFLIFGLSMVPLAVPYWTWQSWVYALLSLTVLRMGPVLLSLVGTELRIRDRCFISWFGPRGSASVLYLEIVILDLGLQGYEPMLAVVVLTVLLSVFLHGLTAQPLAALYPQAPRENADVGNHIGS